MDPMDKDEHSLFPVKQNKYSKALESYVDSCDGYEHSIVQMLRATLEYTAPTDIIAAKLADDINFIIKAEDVKVKARTETHCESLEEGVTAVSWWLWFLYIDIVTITPHDHKHMDCLVGAIENLRKRDTPFPGAVFPPARIANAKDPMLTSDRQANILPNPKWSGVPDFPQVLTEYGDGDAHWDFMPEETSEGELDPMYASFEEWRRLNAFLARLTSSEWAPSLLRPVCEMWEALERTPQPGKLQELRMWIATEWMLRAAHPILDFLREEEKEGCDRERQGRMFATGELCGGDVPMLGIGRWNH